MHTTRTSLRRELITARNSLSPEAQSTASELVVEPILSSVASRCPIPGTVAGYFAYGGELNIGPALDRLRENGWSTAVPVCGAQGEMNFCPWVPGEPLQLSRFGIDEPLSAPLEVTDIDILLVPGVGFDTNGERIGHGVGFYDRWFQRCFDADHDPFRIGVAHDEQIVALPEPEAWDVPMHRVISPSRVLDTSSCE